MASVLAIVSRKIFERDFRHDGRVAGLGDVVPAAVYASAHRGLEGLHEGGDLFLVTVAADEQLWLAGVLAGPRFAKDRWTAAPNTTPITNISHLVSELRFESGKGLTARPGALAMSLQTPRTLSDRDVTLLRSAVGGAPPKPKPVTAKPAKPTKTTQTTPPAQIAVGQGDLARAQAQLAAGDVTGALDALLAAWAVTKAAAIADLIDALGEHVARALPPIATGKKQLDSAWRDVGDQLRPADVPRLLAAFEHGSAKQIEDWLEVLERFPLDPRMCPVAIETSVRFVASSAGPTRTRAFRLAERIADGRCIPQIEKLRKRRSDAWNWSELLERVGKMQNKFAPPPPLAAGDKPAIAALGKDIARLAKGPPPDAAALARAASPASDDGARLLAEVLAQPDDDAARLVYADFLQQQGDPRGELIALQLQPELPRAQQQRVRELLGEPANIARWLGPLAAVVEEPEFERGFLARCKVAFATAKQRSELLAHPLWATVRAIECSEPAIAASPAMRSLHEVRGLDIAGIATLAAHPTPLPIEALRAIPFRSFSRHPYGEDPQNDVPRWAPVLAIGALTKLRAVELDVGWETVDTLGVGPGSYLWLLESRLGQQLTEVAFDFGRSTPQLADWLDVFRERPRLERLAVTCGGHMRSYGGAPTLLTATAVRRGDQFAVELALVRAFNDSADDPLRWEIEHVPPGLFQRLSAARTPELTVTVKPKATRAQLKLLAERFTILLGGRFGTISVVDRDSGVAL
jgi:uncharacterized protein (TIGR02996 family)